MTDPAFEQSRRPTPFVDFEYLDDGEKQREADRLQEIQTIWEWFRRRQEWILAGRTRRSRAIRRTIAETEINRSKTISDIARQFHVKRQSVHQQLTALRKLTQFHEGKSD